MCGLIDLPGHHRRPQQTEGKPGFPLDTAKQDISMWAQWFKNTKLPMTPLFLSIRITGGPLPACQDLAGASGMLWSRKQRKPAESSFYFWDTEALRVQMRDGSGVWIDPCVSRTPYPKSLCLSLPPGLKSFWEASSRRKAGGKAVITTIYLPLRGLIISYQRRENKII